MKRQMTIKFILLLSTAFISLTSFVVGQKEKSKILQPEITFIAERPVVDGSLDKQLESLPVRQFIKNEKGNANFRLAYGTGFFYLYIEADAEHLIYRDRAYQNGDGFIMLIAKPQPNNEPTDEFYELACSAVNKPGLEWSRRIFWNYNVNQIFVNTSNETKLNFREGNGKISFELLLPWDDVRPYHPWISEGIGFDLTFSKAIEPRGMLVFSLIGTLDAGAEFRKRKYTTLQFQKPVVEGKPQTFVSFRQGHISESELLDAVAVTVANKQAIENINFSSKKGKDSISLNKVKYAVTSGITKKEFKVKTLKLAEGNYDLFWNSKNKNYNSVLELSVIPKFDPAALNITLDKSKNKLTNGTYNTARFMIDDIRKKLEILKPYERCENERLAMGDLKRIFDSAAKSIDLLSTKAGFTRKAHLSKVDNTLQPYMVYLPKDFNKNRKYPLMVFLHGSASNERAIMSFSEIIPNGYIAIGPFGRGASNGFCRDNAQEDIAEVIEAVKEDYPIDASKILLTGFSMGGYGVYRTFYEKPETYRAIAIFSGGPNLGKKYSAGAPALDFTDDKNLKPFNNIPVFIFHGEKDNNVSFPMARDIVEKLKKAGARVVFNAVPDKGHERPGKETVDAFFKWLEQVMK